MHRSEVFNAIDSERNYQNHLTMRDDRPDVPPDTPLSTILLAMNHLMMDAQKQWYVDHEPYTATMNILRKVSALAVSAGEKYGMPMRGFDE